MQESVTEFLKQSDPILGKVIDQLGTIQPIDVPFDDNLLPALAKAIICQQISLKVALKIYQRFVALYGDASGLTAQALLDTPEELLRSVGISRPKIRYLQDLAKKTLGGLPTIEQLQMMDDEAIIETLTQVKGVGCWTVQMLLIFQLQRPDVLPLNDLGIRTAMQRLYQLEELPDKKTILALGQRWQPYRSLACRYLWSSLLITTN